MFDVSYMEEADSLGNVQDIDVFDLGLPCTWVKTVPGGEKGCTTYRSIERHEHPDRVCGENKPVSVIVSGGGGSLLVGSLTKNTMHHPARCDEGA
jgi:hypothetical protein